MKTKALFNVVTSALSGIKTNDKDSQNLLFADGSVYSWSPAIAVSAKLPKDAESLTGIINGDDLARFLAKLNKEDIDIKCSDTEWNITSGSMSVKIMARVDASISGKIAKLSANKLSWNPLPSNFYQALSICDIPNNTKKSAGVFMYEDMMVSTDNIRVNKVTLSGKISAKVWLSQFSVSEVIRLKQKFTEYAVSPMWMHFRSPKDENGVQLEFACNRLNDSNYEYKVYSDYIDKVKESIIIEGELPDLSQSVALASCFDDCVQFGDKSVFSNIISLAFATHNVTVSSARVKSGTYKETLPYPNGRTISVAEPLKVRVTSVFLMEACKYSRHFSLAKVGKNTVIRFNGSTFDSVVLVLA